MRLNYVCVLNESHTTNYYACINTDQGLFQARFNFEMEYNPLDKLTLKIAWGLCTGISQVYGYVCLTVGKQCLSVWEFI